MLCVLKQDLRSEQWSRLHILLRLGIPGHDTESRYLMAIIGHHIHRTEVRVHSNHHCHIKLWSSWLHKYEPNSVSEVNIYVCILRGRRGFLLAIGVCILRGRRWFLLAIGCITVILYGLVARVSPHQVSKQVSV